jgi:hypothetical protein
MSDKEKRKITLIVPEDEFNYLLNIAKQSKHFKNYEDREAVAFMMVIIVMHHKTIMKGIDLLKGINEDEALIINSLKTLFEQI